MPPEEHFIDRETLMPRSHPAQWVRLFRRYAYHKETYADLAAVLHAKGLDLYIPDTKWFEFAPSTIETYLQEPNGWLADWTDAYIGPQHPELGFAEPLLTSIFYGPFSPDWRRNWKLLKNGRDGDFEFVNDGVTWRFACLIVNRMFILECAENLSIIYGLDFCGRPKHL